MRVGFFVTCLVDLMRPVDRIRGDQAARIRRRRRLRARRRKRAAASPPTTRATAPTRSRWRARSSRNSRRCDYLVAPSGSCSGMIKTHYAELFADDPAWSARVDGARREDLRADRLPRQRAEARTRCPGTFAGTITYHDSLRRACARWASSRSRARCSAKMAGRAALGDGGVRDVLRLRRHVRDQVRRDLVAARRQQVPAHRDQRRRRGRAGRPRAAC